MREIVNIYEKNKNLKRDTTLKDLFNTAKCFVANSEGRKKKLHWDYDMNGKNYSGEGTLLAFYVDFVHPDWDDSVMVHVNDLYSFRDDSVEDEKKEITYEYEA